jgi:hypothetical protein
MSHDPELLAAAYLTTMRPRARRRFDAHLLACEQCWRKLILARRGRELAETARDLARVGLREDIRAAVTAAAAVPSASQRPRLRVAAAAVMAAAALAGAATVVRAWPRGDGSPAVIAAAVASYRGGQLPGSAVPAGPAPDLTSLDLQLTGAARGKIGGLVVTMFAYTTPEGERVTIIRSSKPFPEAGTARELGGTDDAWTARSRGVTLICAQRTHATLLLGSDTPLVRQASAILNAI